MKSKKISFIVVSEAGGRVRRISFSPTLLSLMALMCIGVVGVCGLFVYGFQSLQQSIIANGEMAGTVMEQRDEIVQQRQQIQTFAEEINALKDELVALGHFEEKIRIIANLDPVEDDGSVFGVGGAAPEDLNPRVELNQGHSDLLRQMHQQVNAMTSAVAEQKSRFDLVLDQVQGHRNLLSSTPAIRPTQGWMTSRFGYRSSPFTGHREFHKGIDIANRKGTAIVATADGVVSFTGKKGGMGRVLVIDHGHGMITRYAHLEKTLKKRGERVTRGDIIAQMGNSGRSTGPHLHYEVHLNGVAVNPANYILN